MAIRKSDFMSFLEARNGAYFLTKTGKEYQAHFKQGRVWFTPQSTGRKRELSTRELEAGVADFNEDGSFKTSDYRQHGVNASYYLPIFDQIADSAKQQPPTEDRKELDGNEPDTDVPGRVKVETTRIIRDTALAQRVKEEHDYTCQICGVRIERASGEGYAEAHHVHPLGEGGPDVSANIMCVCPNHHVMLDYKVLPLDYSGLSGVAPAYIQRHNAQVRGVTKSTP